MYFNVGFSQSFVNLISFCVGARLLFPARMPRNMPIVPAGSLT